MLKQKKYISYVLGEKNGKKILMRNFQLTFQYFWKNYLSYYLFFIVKDKIDCHNFCDDKIVILSIKFLFLSNKKFKREYKMYQ